MTRQYVVPRVSTIVHTEGIEKPVIGATGIVGVIGSAQWGPIDEVVSLSSFADALKTFQDDDTGLTLIKALELIFANGASQVKILRIEHGDTDTGAVAATKNFVNGVTDVIQVDGKYKGAYGNNISVTITANAVDGDTRDVLISDGTKSETIIGAVTNAEIVAYYNANSELVTLTALDTPVVAAITETNLISGSNGSTPTTTNYSTGLSSFETEEMNIVVCAGQSDATVHTAIKTHCNLMAENGKPRIGIVGSAASTSISDNKTNAAALGSDRIVYVAPGIKMTDRLTSTEVTRAPAYTAAAVAGLIANNDVNISITRKPIQGITGLETEYNDSEIYDLTTYRVLTIGKYNGYSPVKDITTSTTSAWDFITTRRIVDYIVVVTESIGQGFIGRLNMSHIRLAMAAVIDAFMKTSKDNNIINDYSIDVTATRAQELAGICKVSLGVQPVFSIYFIDADIFLS